MTESTLPPALAEMAGFLIAKAHAVFHDRASEVIGPGQLGIKHFGCLTVIADEAAGLVERQRNPDDRRAYALEATAAGRAWIAEKRDALLAAQDELLSVLGAEERRNLVSSLQRLLMSQPAELVANPPVEVRAR